MTKLKISFLALLSGLTLVSLRAQSVPALINYQGRLANSDGSPLPTADYELSFRVWDAATNGALMWGPQVFDNGSGVPGHGPRIPVVQGYFNVVLGPVDTNGTSLTDAFNAPSRYVEVTVSNRPPIAPRQQILTTPFAFQAASLARGPSGTNVGVGGIGVSRVIGLFSTSSTSLVEVTELTLDIVTVGRPVTIFLAPGPRPETSYVEAYSLNFTTAGGRVTLWRNGSQIFDQALESGVSYQGDQGFLIPSSSFHFFDFAPRGTNHYVIKMRMNPGNRDIRITNSQLIAYEL